MDEAMVAGEALEFLKRYSSKGHSPMCGNTIGQDRRFMARYMPELEEFFHYRNLDVSTLKELVQALAAGNLQRFQEKGAAYRAGGYL
jgi:oligoribonuclease